jgi:2-polyprenyl-3-methyl-5-hydroxy-6-metoxy-1,4-benzoquinol methylase
MTTIDHYTEDGWGRDAARTVPEARELLALRLLRDADLGAAPRIIDIGCGDGLMLERFHQLRPEASLVGYDLSELQVERARRRLPNAQIDQADLTRSIPEPDGCADVVYAGEVIEHLYSPDDLLDEMARILRPGGLALLTTPNLLSWFNRAFAVAGLGPVYVEYSTRDSSTGMGLLRRVKAGDLPVGHIRVLTAKALRDLLRAAGFSDIRIRGAAFQAAPTPVRRADAVVSRVWPSGAGILVVSARRS